MTSPAPFPAHPDDPLHNETSDDSLWTRANAEEVFPGAITPSTWSMVADGGEIGWREALSDAGYLRRNEIVSPTQTSDRAMSIFFARPAFNVSYLLPAAFNAIASEAALTGPTDLSPLTDSRARDPLHCNLHDPTTLGMWERRWKVARISQRLKRQERSIDRWWRSATDGTSEAGIHDGARLYREVSRLHVFVALTVVSQLHTELTNLVTAADRPDLLLRLLHGYRHLADVRLADELWEVSRGERSLTAFVADHGYHGPAECELSVASWREEPAPLSARVAAMRDLPADRRPATLESVRRVDRREAESELLNSLPKALRPRAWLFFRLARHYEPLRQAGKASLLKVFDGTRAGVRAKGRVLRDKGVLRSPEDAFFLTLPELVSGEGSLQELADFRKDRYLFYKELDVPRLFRGTPRVSLDAAAEQSPRPQSADDALTRTIVGAGVSTGVAEGTARVLKAANDYLAAGEVLVAHRLDPGWGPLLAIATAVVAEVGGAMSHGAIIARELGVPCVFTGAGQAAGIKTGDYLTVDGQNGTIVVTPGSSIR